METPEPECTPDTSSVGKEKGIGGIRDEEEEEEEEEAEGAHPCRPKLDLCKICLEKDMAEYAVLPCKEQHAFCKEAMITNGVSKEGFLACPAAGCAATFDETVWRSFTTPALLERHRFLFRQHQIATDPSLRWCPRTGCETLVRIVQGKRVAACGACYTRLCVSCGSNAHPLRTCSMAADGAFQRWRASKVWTAEGVKRCPRCRFLIEKDGGCRHMTCNNCRCSFCWRCGSDWTLTNTCKWQRLCPVRAVLDSPMWGRGVAIRALTKTAAVVTGVPLTLAAAAVAAAGGVVGGTLFITSLPVIKLNRHIQRRRARSQVAAFQRRVMLVCGLNVMVVGLDGLLEDLSQQVPGRWVEQRGQRRTYAAYSHIKNHPALLYVHEGLRPYDLPVSEEGHLLRRRPPVAASSASASEEEAKDEGSEGEGGASAGAAAAAVAAEGRSPAPASYPPFIPKRTLLLCPYSPSGLPLSLRRPAWSFWQTRATVVQVEAMGEAGLRLHLATPRTYARPQPPPAVVTGSSGTRWPEGGGEALFNVVQTTLDARWMD